MKKFLFLLMPIFLFAGFFDNFSKEENYKKLVNSAVNQAVTELSKGYIKNKLAKIDLPPTLAMAAKISKNFGGDKWANEIVKSINEAATKAVPSAADVFTNSIKNMTTNDVKKIIQGGSFTEFLQKNSSQKLNKIFTPIIAQMMSKNRFATAYNGLNSYIKNSQDVKNIKKIINQFGGNEIDDEDLNSYITRKTLDGLFNVMQNKEKSLRNNSVSKIFEKIF